MKKEENTLNKFYDGLKRLFSSEIIIRKTPDGNLKVADTNQIQKSLEHRMVDRFNRIYTHTKPLDSQYKQTLSYHMVRHELFRDYDIMDNDPIIASALDIYADESTTKNERGEILSIHCEDPTVKSVLQNLYYDVLNIDFNLWSWTRNMCKYGDMYLELSISPKYGIYNIEPMSPYEIQRIEGSDEENPQRIVFKREGTLACDYDNYQVAHFRLLGDSNFLPYGKSMIENGRKVWKQLSLMEDAMMIHRIMRAPEKRIFKFDVGNVPPQEIETFVTKFIDKIKKVPYIDPQTGEYNLRFNLNNMIEDFYLPVRGNDSGTSIENLPGVQWEGIEDIEYLRNKMMAAFKIPKSFLGYDENVGGRAHLASEDVRFARTIDRIQRIVVSELYKIGIVHLYSQGIRDSKMVDFDLELTNPSIILEQERVEMLQSKISLARDMMETNLFSSNYIHRTLFSFDDEQMAEMTKEVIHDKKMIHRLESIQSDGKDPALEYKEVQPEESGDDEPTDDDMGGGGGGSTPPDEPTADEPAAEEPSPAEPEPAAEEPAQESVEYKDKDGRIRKYKHPDDKSFGRDPLGKKERKDRTTSRSRLEQMSNEGSIIALDDYLTKIDKKMVITEKNKVKTDDSGSILDERNLL